VITLHVVVGELAPKSVAISRTTETALWAAPLLRVFYLATKPLVDLFNGLGNLLLRPFGIPPAREVGHAPHSEGELLELLAESRDHGLIEDEEDAPVGLVHAPHDLLAATIDANPVELSELLRPLTRVPAGIPVTELLRRMRDQRREMVLVAGAHGATVGLVTTLEDLLEQLVGEIDEEPLPAPTDRVHGAVAAHATNAL
jgi:CBS domain containing-hemolysin-like protein